MIATRDIDRIIGSEAVDTDNDKIGKVSQVYIDADTEQPTWASVRTGLFGTHETLVPLEQANWDDDVLHVAVDKARIKDAPRVDPDAEISPEEQERLYEYYGLHGSSSMGGGTTGAGTTTDAGTTTTVGGADRGTMNDAGTDRGTTETTGSTGGTGDSYDRARTRADDTAYDESSAGAQDAAFDRTSAGTGAAGFDRDTTDRDRAGGYDTSGPTTDDAMTRSEQRLDVGTEQVQTGRARLRKYVVTEQQTVNVPVSREEVRIEREPITDANRGAAVDGPELSDEEHEVVLNEERPVVNKETVPVERVRLSKEQVTDNRQVTEDVAREEIATDGDGLGGTDRSGRI